MKQAESEEKQNGINNNSQDDSEHYIREYELSMPDMSINEDKSEKKASSREKVKESNIKNICRNYLTMPQFKGLKEQGITSTIYFCYFFCTVLSPRHRVRNIYSEYQVQLLHFFWSRCVPIFFKEFGTLTSHVVIFGDEKKNSQTLAMIKKFVRDLEDYQLKNLMNHFDINGDRIRYIFSNCCSQYYYLTNVNALNVKLDVDSNLQSIRKRKIENIEKIKNGESKPKGSDAAKMSNKVHPWEQRIVDEQIKKIRKDKYFEKEEKEEVEVKAKSIKLEEKSKEKPEIWVVGSSY